MSVLLGIAIGGTKCIAVLGCEENGDIRILGSRTFATKEAGGPYGAMDRFKAYGDELLKEFGFERPDAVGIACGSPLDPVTGVIQSPANLPGWDDIPAVRIMEEHFGAPAYLENDANAGALAEWRFGAAKGYRHIAFLTFGTGLGSGLILNGQLYGGACDMAGECGHIRLMPFGPVGCSKIGSAEGFCSGGGIAQLARDMVYERLMAGEKPALCPTREGLKDLTAKSVAEAAYRGDALAKRIYEVSGEMLGRTLSIMIDLINPEIIVIGSIFARAESLLRPAMDREIAREAFAVSARACKIVPAALGDDVDRYEALAIASYYLAQ
ncbi:MAG: ROK family protein [Clostridia bacterium]|nr:ROK family protein [Clostridia bacterium]